MTDQNTEEGGSQQKPQDRDAQQAPQRGRAEGQRRSGRDRNDRRGRRRRGPAQPAEIQQPQRQPVPAPQDQTPPASLVAYLARAGVGSRRRCDEMVRAGRVTVNGDPIDFPRQKLEPDDVVAVDGEAVAVRALRYVLLNKPRGVASTRSDPHAERIVVDLVPDGRVLFPVGRLDVNTTGLIVLTNDGPLAHRLMHPSYGVPKTYVVRVRGRVGRRELAELRGGVELEDGMTAPADARLLKQSGKSALVELTIHQGRKRQVRRMFTALGLTVDDLQRQRYGPLADSALAAGAWRELSGEEVDALRRAAEHVETCVSAEPVEEAVALAAQEHPAAADERGRGAPESVAEGADPAEAASSRQGPDAGGELDAANESPSVGHPAEDRTDEPPPEAEPESPTHL